jgi:PleD family two-component response regulator
VVTACDGDQAIPHLFRHRPDVILADIDMPKLDGFALCQLVRSHADTRRIPFIFLSSYSSKKVEALRIGGDDFLSKPVDPAVLRQRVRARVSG